MSLRISCCWLIALGFGLAGNPCYCAAGATIEATTPVSFAVWVNGTRLKFAPPEREIFEAAGKDGVLPDAPQNYSPQYEKKVVWPDTLRLTPVYDSTRTHILGHFFRSFRPETLVVESASGVAYQKDVDFVFQDEWGVIANKEGRMTGKVKARGEAALQRLDLIQLDSNGFPSVKQGKSSWVCPELPSPDAGQTALAGIYIAPWPAARNPHFDKDPGGVAGASEYAITTKEIFPVREVAKIELIHPEAISGTLSKLREGKPVKIAFMGDSITLGAESTRWWMDKYDEKSLTWKGRFIYGLRQRFPAASIEVIEAYQGGVPISYGEEKIGEVAAQKPDLVVVAFGVNDADSNVDGPPKTSLVDFKKSLGVLADRTKAAGGEALFVTPFPLTPWLRNGQATRLDSEYVPAIKAVADAKGAAVADVNSSYRQLDALGIPWVSQNHNWINHPGNLGHQVYSDTLLRGFPKEVSANPPGIR